jgi:NAD(P)H-dependent FMN reductase
VQVLTYEGLAALPHFNPDLDTDTPPVQVLDFRRAVGEADGLLISSPEYAHGMAGAFKNGLDWLVASLEFPEKPVAVLNAAARAHHADAQLREVLATMSERLCRPASITLTFPSPGMDAEAMATDAQVAAALSEALAAFTAFVRHGSTDPD